MRALPFLFALSLACLTAGAPAAAQEGHPLRGSWIGTWAGNKIHGPDVVVVMNWDGKNISGIINPGPDVIPMKVATLDSTKWTVHLEYDLKDKSGKPVPFIVDAKLQNASSRTNRMLVGTFTHGSTKGDFKIKMDN